MAIRIITNPHRLCRWVLQLGCRLQSAFPHQTVEIVSCVGPAVGALPPPILLLLDLEALIHRLPADRLGAVVERGTENGIYFGPPSPSSFSSGAVATVDADTTIDLVGTDARSEHIVRVEYDGIAGEAQVYGCLIDGRLPRIEIVSGSRHTLAAGIPDAAASTLSLAADNVFARTITLILMALARRGNAAAIFQNIPQPVVPTPAAVPTYGRLAETLARRLAWASAKQLYKLCCHAPHWRIGWRFVDGDGVFERGDLGGTPWRVLADPGQRFFADPFPIRVEGRDWIFFEDFDHRTQKGTIACVEVRVDGSTGPVVPVLEEPWHLSYPFLIEDGGRLYMMPESSAAGHLSLYRAERFPDRWVLETRLITDVDISDATIVNHNGRLWMFGSQRDGFGSHNDTLAIYSASHLTGTWRPHALTPMLVDPRTARPAGNVIQKNNNLWRVVQDCAGGYGRAVGITAVTRLDDEGFEQTLLTTIYPTLGWPGRRFHTLNRAGRLECIDGSAISRKWS